MRCVASHARDQAVAFNYKQYRGTFDIYDGEPQMICVDQSQICDVVQDCLNGEDEMECGGEQNS